jgi:DNA-binding PadR family transcriptional regulator
MPEREELRLSLTEWLVLCLVGEKPTHGFALGSLLGARGDLGRVWRVPRPVIYRSLHRLEALALTGPAGLEPSAVGPVRQLTRATAAGRAAAAAWLSRPAEHGRDIRTELLVKLALLDRAGADPADLLRAQHAQLAPIAAALDDRLDSAEGFDRTLTLWRRETMSATLRFLSALAPQPGGADLADRATRGG